MGKRSADVVLSGGVATGIGGGKAGFVSVEIGAINCLANRKHALARLEFDRPLGESFLPLARLADDTQHAWKRIGCLGCIVIEYYS